MAYDTLTAMTVPGDAFRPQPEVGWKPVTEETWFDVSTGEVRNRYKWVWNQDSYDFTFRERHKDEDAKLMLQLSYPRALDGNNVQPWESDPSRYRDQLAQISGEVHRRLEHAAGIPDYLSWRVFRLDATTNYHLGDESQVAEVLRSLHERRIPGVKISPRSGDRRSVMWTGKTRDYIAYSKYAERLDYGDAEGALQAAGVLRAEARVTRCHAVRRVINKALGLDEKVFPTVGMVTTPEAVPLASRAITGKFANLVCETIGGTAVKHAVEVEALVVKLGPLQAAEVLGAHYLWLSLGEVRLREVCATKYRNQFTKFMQRIKRHGYDPRSVALDLGLQLPLVSPTTIAEVSIRDS